jgi:hypothetical protein
MHDFAELDVFEIFRVDDLLFFRVAANDQHEEQIANAPRKQLPRRGS